MSAASPARHVAAVVVVAMAEEAEPFLNALLERGAAEPEPPTPLGEARARSLRLPGEQAEHELILVRSGIGLVAAASALTASSGSNMGYYMPSRIAVAPEPSNTS